jgi:Spx/MgsR family transcriptional regulator
MTTTMYGIPNCDTIKKARAFLAGRAIAYQFHDYKKLGVPAVELASWVERLGWERLLNRQGNTWRRLAPEVQAAVHDAASACRLMAAEPSAIRRPVLVSGPELLVGFDPATWARHFG